MPMIGAGLVAWANVPRMCLPSLNTCKHAMITSFRNARPFFVPFGLVRTLKHESGLTNPACVRVQQRQQVEWGASSQGRSHSRRASA